ncbi:MAG: hypothetical protein J6I58_00115 [Eubacterium sp.]|nr:hypothetical protein [Eubacterium sp.]
MACFLVSAAEAVVVKVAEKAQENVEKKTEETASETRVHVSFSRKLKWLSYMLWGGVILLAFEHIWHGEIQPFFPFLTAMESPASTAEMLHEMATVGVAMALLITAVWGVICLVTSVLEKKASEEDTVTAE